MSNLRLIQFAEEHGMVAVTHGIGIKVYIPYIMVSTNETGTDEVICYTMKELMTALGY